MSRVPHESMDVVVIGGGIVGVAVAYYLAERGIGDVTVVEADTWGAGATGGSYGGVRQQFAHPLEIEFSRRGLEFWKSVELRFDSPCPFHENGYLLLTASKETAAQLEAAAEVQRECGMPEVYCLGGEEVRSIAPWLHVDDIQCGSWTPRDGHVMPMDGLMALMKAARRLGASFRDGWRVDGIESLGSRWLVHGREDLLADLVVIAAGGGTRRLLQPYGIDLDITAAYNYGLLTGPTLPGQRVPLTIDVDTGMAVEREGQALVLSMLGRNPPPSDHMDLIERFTAAASHRAPSLTQLPIVKNISARPLIGGDDGPYLGEVEPGLWAIAFTGHGVMHGPPLAELLARRIVGDPEDLDVSKWDLRRESGPPTHWWRRQRTS
jgi:sarcosine oxidase subunit beta